MAAKIEEVKPAFLFWPCPLIKMCSTVSIATGWLSRAQFLAEARVFLYFTVSRPAHLACPVGTMGDRAAMAWSWPHTYILRWDQEWWNYTPTSPCLYSVVLN
jgi:hypothetical protein